MTEPLDRLLALLDLDELGQDRYRVPNPDRGYGPRVFGGQVAAQALRAAQRSVAEERSAHSFHGYFLLPGQPGAPIVYEIERTRDGRSFTTRRVVALQGDDVIFEASVSFHRREEGHDYQQPLPRDVPAPADSPPMLTFIPEEERANLPFEWRDAGASAPDERGWVASTRRAWMRIREPVPADDAVHQCLCTFMSDMGAVMAAIAPGVDLGAERIMGASLDHSLWFHRAIRVDEWFLYDAHSVSNFGARGLMRGTLHSEAGVLGVSVAQEALLRIPR